VVRQAIWDAARARAAQHPLPAGAVATINRAAVSGPLVPELAAGGTTAGWAAPVRTTQALSTPAREMIELLSGRLSGRMRGCASDDCPLVFVDSSRPGARRWCAMEPVRQSPQAPGSARPAGHGPAAQPPEMRGQPTERPIDT
jgi:predicted RNA-binding Zn ribbon-like protein